MFFLDLCPTMAEGFRAQSELLHFMPKALWGTIELFTIYTTKNRAFGHYSVFADLYSIQNIGYKSAKII